MSRLYVGCKVGQPRKVFRAKEKPTFDSHGHLYNAVIGPFRTKAAAVFMAEHGGGNPHCLCVADAERIVRKKGN